MSAYSARQKFGFLLNLQLKSQSALRRFFVYPVYYLPIRFAFGFSVHDVYVLCTLTSKGSFNRLFY